MTSPDDPTPLDPQAGSGEGPAPTAESAPGSGAAPADRDGADSGAVDLPVLPVRATVLFPVRDVMSPLLVSREFSVSAVDAALKQDRRLLVVAQQEPEDEEIGGEDLYSV